MTTPSIASLWRNPILPFALLVTLLGVATVIGVVSRNRRKFRGQQVARNDPFKGWSSTSSTDLTLRTKAPRLSGNKCFPMRVMECLKPQENQSKICTENCVGLGYAQDTCKKLSLTYKKLIKNGFLKKFVKLIKI